MGIYFHGRLSALMQYPFTRLPKSFTYRILVFACIIIGLAHPQPTHAATAVSWTSPGDGSSYFVGTNVTSLGQASGSGTIGSDGLHLAVVVDLSGSMGQSATSGGITAPRRIWQRNLVVSLLNSLPVDNTIINLIGFSNNAQPLINFRPLNLGTSIYGSVLTNTNLYGGGTNIAAGIDLAAFRLNNPTPSLNIDDYTRIQVVFSDGEPGPNVPSAPIAALNAVAGGVDAIHTITLPGGNTSVMNNIASAGSGTHTDGTDLSTLTAILDDAIGNLVDVDQVNITLPDGTVLLDVPVDALGNFDVDWTIVPGNNVFTVTAFGTDGSSATATRTLIGVIPSPAGSMLAGVGLILLLLRRQTLLMHQ